MSELKPCPFCGAGETRISENRHSPTMSGGGGLISVEITHWCPAVPGQPSRNTITRTGRDHTSAVAAWNSRPPGWRTMDDAPLDGTAVLVYARLPAHAQWTDPDRIMHPLQSVAAWHPDAGFCVCEVREVIYWQPLPEPPE